MEDVRYTAARTRFGPTGFRKPATSAGVLLHLRLGNAAARPRARHRGHPFGSLDDDPGRGADDHIFVASKAPWHEITDDLPRFDEAPG